MTTSGNIRTKSPPAVSEQRARLLRPPTETVEDYVDWLRHELGPEWAKLARDPRRLAQVSLTNYGIYKLWKNEHRTP